MFRNTEERVKAGPVPPIFAAVGYAVGYGRGGRRLYLAVSPEQDDTHQEGHTSEK